MQRKTRLAKESSIPSLRVDRRLRKAAESVLREGETLSNFVEKSLRENIYRRETQREFVARGLDGLAAARQDDTYFSAAQVLRELKSTLTHARKAAAKKR
ncbi:MAG: YlcI/YnfO family protein [Rudaea sp.]